MTLIKARNLWLIIIVSISVCFTTFNLEDIVCLRMLLFLGCRLIYIFRGIKLNIRDVYFWLQVPFLPESITLVTYFFSQKHTRLSERGTRSPSLFNFGFSMF